MQVMAACFELHIPLTPRGGGTGNYGQAMPLSGGVVLDLSGMKQVKTVAPGRVVAEPGAILALMDQQTRRQSGQELRLHPSTYQTASIGGYVAGGSGGVGSIRWGGLRDCGNIIRLKVATMEASPRLIDLTGDDLHKVAHAYGTNGIITEVEMPLAPAYEWIDLIAGFPTLRDAMVYANSLGEQDGLLLKNVAVVAGAGRARFLRALPALPASRSPCRDRHRGRARARCLARLHAPASPRGNPVPRATRCPRRTARDCRRPSSSRGTTPRCGRCARIRPSPTCRRSIRSRAISSSSSASTRGFGAELPAHVEFVRFDGKVTCLGVPLVRFTTEERLEEIVRIHEEMGASIFNPHRYTLEEGGMKRTDEVQLAFKSETDPRGLLNPGKMIAWDDPDYDYRSGKTYLFPALGQRMVG